MFSTTFVYSLRALQSPVVAENGRLPCRWVSDQFNEFRVVDTDTERSVAVIRWGNQNTEAIKMRNGVVGLSAVFADSLEKCEVAKRKVSDLHGTESE
jgi:hypothetical protein